MQLRMRNRKRHIKEKGVVLIFPDEAQRLLYNKLVCVFSGIQRHPYGFALLYLKQAVGVIMMGMRLVQVTIKRVEAMFFRRAGGILLAQAPFAEHARNIPFVMQA